MSMMLLVTTVLPVSASEVSPRAKGKVSVTTKDGGVPVFQYGKAQKLTLAVKNNTSSDLHNVKLNPQMDTSADQWPFKIEKQNYEKTIATLAAGKTADIEYTFTERDEVATASYYILFDVTTDEDEEDEEPQTAGVYVKTTAKPEEKPKEETGSVENGAITGGEGSTSVPRVIVTGFSTEPGEVKAGSNFKLIVHLKNTSKKTAVRNMLFDFSAPAEGDGETASPAFLPASGSSTVYLDGIKANGTKDISIELSAKADLTQKPYSVEMSMKYEDNTGAQYDGSSSLSIPVKQDARFEFSEFELSADTIEVGNEVNIMCNLYNLGRTKLYNVKVRFDGEGISNGEVFVGNVESGGTASIDSMVTGEAATTGDGLVKMVMTYEDESGAVTTFEKELTIFVTEPMMMDEEMYGDMEMEEEKGFSIWPWIILVLIIVAVVATVIIVKKKKKKKLETEEEGLVDELDRLTEDEQ